jgi:DNA-binding transcriptional regulator YdaS (Cro superfamily)
MDISTYIRQAGLTQQEFADRVGCTQGAVSQWLMGKNKPSPKRAIDIERATDGAVTAEELCPEVFGGRAA